MHINWQNRLSLAVPARRLTIMVGLLIAGTTTVLAQPPTVSGFPPDQTTDPATQPVVKPAVKPTTPKPVTPKPSKAMSATKAVKVTKAAPPKKTKTDPKKTSKMPVGNPKVVLVFPLDAKGTGEQLSDIVTDVIKSRLQLSGKYAGVSFVTSIPAIRRGVNDQSLSQADVQAPFTSRTKVQKLTAATGYELAIVSSLDQYDYNAETQNVSLVLSIQMTDFSGGTPKNYTAAEPVTTAPKSAKTATDTAAAEAAIRTLAEKLVVSVLNSANGTTAK